MCALSGYSTGSGKLEMVDFSYKKEIAWFVEATICDRIQQILSQKEALTMHR